MRFSILNLLLIVSMQYTIQGQNPGKIFEPVENAEKVLNNIEIEMFRNLSDGKVREKTLIDVSGMATALENHKGFFPIKGIEHNWIRVKYSPKNDDNFTFKGRLTEALGELYLYKTNGYLYGNIHMDSLAYQIEPINKKYSVLLRRDYSRYKSCPLVEEQDTKDEAEKKKKSGSSQTQIIPILNPDKCNGCVLKPSSHRHS